MTTVFTYHNDLVWRHTVMSAFLLQPTWLFSTKYGASRSWPRHQPQRRWQQQQKLAIAMLHLFFPSQCDWVVRPTFEVADVGGLKSCKKLLLVRVGASRQSSWSVAGNQTAPGWCLSFATLHVFCDTSCLFIRFLHSNRKSIVFVLLCDLEYGLHISSYAK